MNRKTILITGATSGIGYAGAEEMGRQGWRVLVHARSEARGMPIIEKLRSAVPGGSLELVLGDLASLKLVAALAEQVKAKAETLDVLWNNAGGMVRERKLSADGIEYQIAVDHLAPFALTKLLLPAPGKGAARPRHCDEFHGAGLRLRRRHRAVVRGRGREVSALRRLQQVQARHHPVHPRARLSAQRD